MRNVVILFLSVFATVLAAQDTTPPALDKQIPAPNSVVREFFQAEVFFTEDVTNVTAGDLRVNGVAATNVINVNGTGVGTQFIFEFVPPATGVVNVAFISGHGITDLADPPNAFAGASWSFTLNPNAPIDGLVINEFMADNENGIRDEDGDTSDWIELFNGSTETINLQGWHLTDNRLDLTRWTFPNVGIPPSEYMLIFASGVSRTNPTSPLHTSFRLSSNPNSYLALVDPTGTNVVSVFLNYPQQYPDISYGRDRVSPNFVGYYSNSTPRAANSTTGSGVLPAVQFSRDSSTFVTPFDLTLSVNDTNAIIRYLLVNSGASASTNVFLTTNSPIYTGPIPITGTMQVRARAFPKTGVFFPGPLHSETYIQINPNLLNFSSDLPLIIIHNFGQGAYPATEGAQTELNSVIAVIDADLDRSALTNHPVLVMRAGINTRGSSTLGYAKKSFAVEFWDEFNDNRDEPLLGMPAESDWTLYAPNNFEPGLIHNPLFYRMSREIGRYASRTRFAEVFLAASSTPMEMVGTNHYNGVYVVAERPKRSDGRVNIPNLQVEDTNAPAVTGGYLLSVDRLDSNERSFSVPAVGVVPGQTVIYKDPKGPDIQLPQRDPQEQYITGYFRNFVTNLASVGFNSPTGYVQYIDPDSWVDHMIINVTAFNVDALRLSGFFYKDRSKPLEMGPVWDCDRCLGSTDGRDANPRTWRSATGDLGTDFFNYPWWGRLFSDTNFWQSYIDRYQEVRKVAYSDTNMFAIIGGFAAELAESYPREFARWRVNPRGTNGTGAGTFATEIEWKKNWMAARLHFMDTNFLSPVILSRAEGQVTAGTTVTLTPPDRVGGQTTASTNAVVYYTLNGTDPRAFNGEVAVGAFSNLGPVTITVTTNVRVFARAYNPAHRNLTGSSRPPVSSSWSGPSEATYWISTPPLRITELMYHPSDPPPGVTTNADNFEYVEVKNIGSTPLNVNRFRLRGGVDFDFPNAVLAAGEHAVLVRNLAAFQSRYGLGPRVLGVYTNDNLSNDGEQIILQGGVREPILDFVYSDEWYPITDGAGFSLQIVNDAAPTNTWNLRESWRPSGVVQGTPGAPDGGAPALAAVYINEALTHTDPSPGDAIELYNSTAEPANIGNWYLTDNFDLPKKYRIPAGTTIPANGYLVLYQSNTFGLGATSFALSSKGEEVHLFSGDANGNLTGWHHGFDFGAQANGATFGRHVISTGEDHFVTQVSPTLGGANSGPKVGPVVISEINYHPPDLIFPRASVDNESDEYIELHNITGSPAPLYDLAHPANTWQLRDAVDFTFPTGATIPASGFVLVVSFDPADSVALNRFRTANNVPIGTPIYGPWSGKLDNSQDSIELVRPDLPDPPGSPTAGFVPYILADKVNYQDVFPWPTGLPDGLGAALGRINVAGYGDDSGNWRTSPKTPGAPLPTGGEAPAIVTQPANTVGIETFSASFTVVATGSALGYQWTFNGKPIPSGSAATLTLNNLQLNQAGTYACYVFNSAGAVLSSNATLSIRMIARITQHPVSRSVYIKPDPKAANLVDGTNVTFTVAATTVEPPLSYQWRFNGTNIPGATTSSLVVTNVQLDDEGDYSVAVTDGAATVVSFPGRLVPLLSPIITQKPADISVAAGQSFSVSVEALGNPLPFAYSWRRNQGSLLVNTNNGNYRSNFVTFNTTDIGLNLINNIVSSNYVMRIVIYNDANTTPGVTTTFNVTVLADADQDGLPDVVELGLGLATNNPADAANDLDLDGMSNLAEHLAGTDPTNSLSYLKIEENIVPGLASVQVAVVSNRTYSVQYSDNLNSTAWSKLADIVSRVTNRVETVPDPTWNTNRFYRVVLPHQP